MVVIFCSTGENMLGEKEIIGQSSSLREVFSTLSKVAPTDTTVLVTGESGTGKELLLLQKPGAYTYAF